MKVIIAGSRNFNDYNLLKSSCDNLLTQFTNIEIVSGTARGADKLGERYAREKGYSIKEFPANWNLGKSAGYIRNDEMAQYADMLIAFWDGTSKGTKHMIDLANKRSLKVIVIDI
jgi:hypothetical protein